MADTRDEQATWAPHKHSHTLRDVTLLQHPAVAEASGGAYGARGGLVVALRSHEHQRVAGQDIVRAIHHQLALRPCPVPVPVQRVNTLMPRCPCGARNSRWRGRATSHTSQFCSRGGCSRKHSPCSHGVGWVPLCAGRGWVYAMRRTDRGRGANGTRSEPSTLMSRASGWASRLAGVLSLLTGVFEGVFDGVLKLKPKRLILKAYSRYLRLPTIVSERGS
jgi:hypothetical protein